MAIQVFHKSTRQKSCSLEDLTNASYHAPLLLQYNSDVCIIYLLLQGLRPSDIRLFQYHRFPLCELVPFAWLGRCLLFSSHPLLPITLYIYPLYYCHPRNMIENARQRHSLDLLVMKRMKIELDGIQEQTERLLEEHDQPTDILYQLARRGVSQTS